MKHLPIAALILFIGSIGAAEEVKKPVIKVTDDGFPAGNATPEGAACDLARAFINQDSKLFKKVCIEPFGGDNGDGDYGKFLKRVVASMETEAKKGSTCLLYTSPSPRDQRGSRMPSSA